MWSTELMYAALSITLTRGDSGSNENVFDRWAIGGRYVPFQGPSVYLYSNGALIWSSKSCQVKGAGSLSAVIAVSWSVITASICDSLLASSLLFQLTPFNAHSNPQLVCQVL